MFGATRLTRLGLALALAIPSIVSGLTPSVASAAPVQVLDAPAAVRVIDRPDVAVPLAAGVPAPGERASADTSGAGVEQAPDGRLARAGSVVVTFQRDTSAATRTAALGRAASLGIETVGSGRTVRVQGRPGALAGLLAAYRDSPGVERVEPDYILQATFVPNDPRYVDEWALPRIQAPSAWDRSGGGQGIKVGILDTGIADHPDLRGQVVAAQNFSPSTRGTGDYSGHGTHVAGTVAAIANNNVGVSGIAWGASLLNAKVLGDDGIGSLSSVANGIVWAADNGARVINLSLGAPMDCPTSMQDAIDYAWSRGVVLVAAAGNQGMNAPGTPSNCNNVIPVGAIDGNDLRASFSNYGPAVPLAAPGTMILSTSRDGGYGWMSGTSMASPHVAAVAALVWGSSYGTSNRAVVDRLFSTAERIAGTGSLWAFGLVNAANAVGAGAAPPSPPASSPTPSPVPAPAPPTSPAPPVSCSPRPPVVVKTAPLSPGVLGVTITAMTAADSTTNGILQVRFGTSTNAVIEASPQRAASGNFEVHVPAGSQSYSFTIRRASPGVATTVPFIVVDRCGDWPSLAGGGPSAF
ncbi:MAG: S8 family serine peptidase [Chloroflexi bacterium]|nr:S8 family serine peptidase [Chloroflexota bacterium]